MTELFRADGMEPLQEEFKEYENMTLHFNYLYKYCAYYSNAEQNITVVFCDIDYRDEFRAVETIAGNQGMNYRVYSTGDNNVA